ncbi:right-handed parallel beta-helix repeat-containing protein [Lacisediminihabitans sp. FW035]
MKLEGKFSGLRWKGKALIAIGAAACIAVSAVSIASAHGLSQNRTTSAHTTSSHHAWGSHKTRHGQAARIKAAKAKPVPVVVTPPVAAPPVTTPPVTTPPVAAPPVSAPPVAPGPSTPVFIPGVWPTAATTGVPAGTRLTASGSLTIRTAGTVIDGLDITGDVSIMAPNVTIKNSRVTGQIDNESTGTLIQRVEIAGPGVSGAFDAAVGWSNFTCDGCNVHGWGKGFYMVDGNVTIKNSWVHDLSVSGDPGSGGSHNEAIFTQGGTNYVITGNRLDSGTAPNFSAAVALYGQQKAVMNSLVQGNLMNGGGYCIYAGYDAGIKPSNVRFLDNTFGNSAYSSCGKYGPAVAFYAGNGNQWSNNVMLGGALVSTPGGL